MHHQKPKAMLLQLFVCIAWVNCRVAKGSDAWYRIGRHIQNMRNQDIPLSAWQRGLFWWYVQNYPTCFFSSFLSDFEFHLRENSIYQQQLLGIYFLILVSFTSPELLICSDSNHAWKEVFILYACQSGTFYQCYINTEEKYGIIILIQYDAKYKMSSISQHIDISPVIFPSLMSGGKTAEEALENCKKEWTVWATFCFTFWFSDHSSSGVEAELLNLKQSWTRVKLDAASCCISASKLDGE